MPGSLVSDHCNFSYHRSNAATSAFLIHQHDCYELYYYISGDLRFLYDGTEYAPAPHTMFLVVPGVLHGIHVLSDTTYERYTFHFTPRFFARERQDLLHRLLPNLESVRKRASMCMVVCPPMPRPRKLWSFSQAASQRTQLRVMESPKRTAAGLSLTVLFCSA